MLKLMTRSYARPRGFSARVADALGVPVEALLDWIVIACSERELYIEKVPDLRPD